MINKVPFHSLSVSKLKKKSYISVPDSGAITSAPATGSSKTIVLISAIASAVDPSGRRLGTVGDSDGGFSLAFFFVFFYCSEADFLASSSSFTTFAK